MKKILLFILIPAGLFAGSVLPLGLSELVRDSGTIFVGRCVEVSRELDENDLPSLWARFGVSEGIRGVESGEDLLVKQFGGSAAYRVGEDVLLFLYPESRLGFSSPVGLGQGYFRVQAGMAGEKIIYSPFPHLFQDVGGESLEAFVARIRARMNHDGR